ncbi:hypothetical protein GBF38_018363 [Nibea albiflora]|uniref:Uncharacterized protein n=1 Tax=Nibea albiflora TaxID=240163 RepID=A0ACB7EFI9_NIBAL|nr:hypothetical protein GBF38_018363 [Nibea albiflora]
MHVGTHRPRSARISYSRYVESIRQANRRCHTAAVNRSECSVQAMDQACNIRGNEISPHSQHLSTAQSPSGCDERERRLSSHIFRRGKERKGKERKGKERKGKERKGKERKGKERKGRTAMKFVAQGGSWPQATGPCREARRGMADNLQMLACISLTACHVTAYTTTQFHHLPSAAQHLLRDRRRGNHETLLPFNSDKDNTSHR